MKKINPAVDKKNLEAKLKDYSKLSKALVLKPFKKPQSLLPLGAAFLAGMPSGDAAIIYSGVVNIPVNIPINNPNGVFININGGGGNDFEMQHNNVGGIAFIQANEVGGADFALNGFIGVNNGIYVYPFANNSGFAIGAAGPWRFAAGDSNTMADNHANENQYPNTKWELDGMTAFIGFRGVLGGGTKYGWIRITRNTHTNWTIVDWAYNSTTNASIVAGQTMPVELMSFDYRLNANGLQLTWRTASEVDNAGFDVERSEDGKTFRSIAWVEGNGTTSEFKDYVYDDKNLREGKTFYYRLRQVDYNGQFDFSPVITVTVGSKGSVVGEFYPNPASARVVQLDFSAKEDADWSAVVYDAMGKEIRREQLAVTNGGNQFQFDFSGLGSGAYFVKLENGTERVYRKLVLD